MRTPKVLAHTTVSLDGFIAEPNDEMDGFACSANPAFRRDSRRCTPRLPGRWSRSLSRAELVAAR